MTAPRIYHETILVGPESIDVQGHVNNREYLRWMELAATNHAALLHWGIDDLKRTGRAWVAREHWIEYLRPCFAGETLDIYTWIQSVRGPTSLRRHAIAREGLVTAVGATEWVYIDAARGRPVSIDAASIEGLSLVKPSDEELKQLGISRPVRFSPGASLISGDE